MENAEAPCVGRKTTNSVIALHEAGITQNELSKLVGIPAPKLSRILRRWQKPTASELDKLAIALKVFPDTLGCAVSSRRRRVEGEVAP